MSKLTFEVSVGNVKTYLNELAKELTFQIALDKNVVLQNTMMEGGFAIGIDNWDDVRETIADSLRLWCYAMSNRTALPVPIPKPFYALLYYIVYRGAKDQRGGVRFKLKIQSDFLPSGVNTGFQQALFGADGYFRKRFGFLEGLEYLENGVPKVPNLIVGKENNLLTAKKTISEKSVEVPAHRVLCAVTDDKSNVVSVSGIDGFDLDTTGMMSLIPPIELEDPDHFGVIYDRLVTTSYVPESGNFNSGLAACWLMAKGDELYAIRNMLPCTPNSAMYTDLQRSILEAEEMIPTVDLPSNIQLSEAKSKNPKHLELSNVSDMVFTAYCLMNPYLLSQFATTRTVNALVQTMSRAVGTVVQSESLRAHKFRFLTFNSATGGMTGFTFFYTVPQTVDAHLTSSITDLDFAMSSVRTILNSYKSIRSAPLISQDLNRVPITPKYCLYAVGDSLEDKTSAPSNFEAEEDASRQTEGIFKFVQKAMQVVVTGGSGTPDIQIDSASVLQAANFLTGTNPGNINQIVTELEKLQGPDVDNNGVSRKDVSALFQQWDFSKCTTKSSVPGGIASLYSFTKLKEAGLINNSDKLRYCFYYPLLTDSHKLIRNGYCKNGKFYEDPSRTIARANLVDRNTGKAITEYGVIVSGLLQKGGFGGFGDILGALTGSLGAVAGGFLGVPQLGQITGQLGKVGGDLLGDLF